MLDAVQVATQLADAAVVGAGGEPAGLSVFADAALRESAKGVVQWAVDFVRRRGRKQPTLEAAVEAAVTGGADERQRLVEEILAALRDEPGLLEDAAARLQSVNVEASGVRSVAIGGGNAGVINTGDIERG